MPLIEFSIMVIKEIFSVPILSVVAGSSVAFRSPVVERFHCINTAY